MDKELRKKLNKGSGNKKKEKVVKKRKSIDISRKKVEKIEGSDDEEGLGFGIDFDTGKKVFDEMGNYGKKFMRSMKGVFKGNDDKEETELGKI